MKRTKERLARGEVIKGFGLGQLISPKFVEVVGVQGGFDVLWLDHEHGGITLKDVELATLAARAYGLESFVRTPATDYAQVMRWLEAGAGGVMISMVRTEDEAEQAVRWVKFAPRGQRGLNGSNRDGRFGLEPLAEYVARANAETFVGVQIETAEALDRVEAIARVPDVDLVFVGPVDLSQVLGRTGQFDHPDCLGAIERIASACRSAGKPWGIVPQGPDHARRMRQWGCQLFVFGFDIRVVHAGIAATRERYETLYEPVGTGLI
ncbi:MAG: aldolase [Isosphaeraceae bacterium]|jgi:2-dehydro-3-deoxyglucarate aldolase/4-hydroxy-2-oxoheptanedioate aldolase|nr:MAG: aldolase [Isosphaeraceae bacterium]